MKDLLREAKKAARMGDYSRAGDLCDMAGHPLDAIAYYLQGKHHLLAGQVAARIGEHAQAAGYFSNGGDSVQAAEMYLKAGQKKKAAMMFERSGQYLKAAELEEKMNNHTAAAAYYEMGDQTEKAAYLFAQAGDNARAAALYEKLLGHRSGGAIDSGAFSSNELTKRNARFSRFAGILYMKAGQFSKAGPLLEEASLYEQAVQAYRKAGRTDRAAALLMKLENYSEALKLVEDDPNAGLDARMVGELYLRSGRFRRAAEVFLAEGLHFKAAECFESEGDLGRAAELFAAEGELIRAADLYSGIARHAEAARAYEKAGEMPNAGRSYEKAGMLLEAARCYTASGRVYESALVHLQRGARDQAIRILQQVPREGSDYGKASFTLGGLFYEQTLYAPAAERFEAALRHTREGTEKVKCLYQLGLCYEQMGRAEEARSLYEKILSVDYHHADVAARLQSLAKQVARPAAPAPALPQADPGTGGRPLPANITGRLELQRELGRGQHCVVFEAYDRVLGKKIAVKKYPASSGAASDMVSRFLREAQKASDLSHPHHVTVYGVGEDTTGRYVLQELVETRTLREVLDEKIRLEPARVIEFATQIADLLSHAHRKGLIHRDLRPENIFLVAEDQVKVADFGLKARMTDPAAMAGRAICYMSPEAIRSEKVDERSDIYALGTILYELVLGEPPFPPETAAFDHINLQPPFPTKVDRLLPAFLRKILERCLEKDRTRRYRSAAQVLDELKASAIVPGAVIAERYEIVRELGLGGMGRIYQALDRDLEETVALKVLRGGDGEGRQVERFLREIKMTRKISHPNVVKVFDLGNWREHRYITMEYIDGVNLEQWVRLQSGVDLTGSIRMMAQIARGLESAHALGIIHRDIKPQNILMKDNQIPKVLDFGIARTSEANDMTTAGFVMGSPKYMSPEQVQAQPLDLRTDIYSMGVVMYFVFTGREPFVGDTPSVIAYKHIGEEPRSPRELNAAIPVWLADVILRCLAKDREKRFRSMADLASTLEAGLGAPATQGASQES